MKGLGSETLGHFMLACDGVRQGLGRDRAELLGRSWVVALLVG